MSSNTRLSAAMAMSMTAASGRSDMAKLKFQDDDSWCNAKEGTVVQMDIDHTGHPSADTPDAIETRVMLAAKMEAVQDLTKDVQAMN